MRQRNKKNNEQTQSNEMEKNGDFARDAINTATSSIEISNAFK